ncbi:MAG: adenosylmethionine--8-amino-7-oxononanoate transaminase [Spirochaetia bacterium]|nr:adenosylmethionine--8-amino-7-oxononanoate transaminase [Spirochaetia bacterium]
MNIIKTDSNNIWHPFTQAKNSPPIINIKSGKGIYLYDDKGNKFIDAISSWWVNLHGHGNEYIAQKISEQAKKLEHVIFAGFTHEQAVHLSERLLKILPENQSKIFYSDNGSTAVEVALKICIQYWYNKGVPKNKFIAFENSYHGDTFGAMSVGNRSIFTNSFNSFLFDTNYIPLPTEKNIDQILNKINQFLKSKEIAGFIFEPLVLGAGGMKMYNAKYLNDILKLFKKNKILTIADEVMTGFYRTGKIFASDYLSFNPDIICLSKGITGGFLPLGVTSCTENIYKAFYSNDIAKTFFHGHSYTANPISCAAANASLDLLLTSNCKKQIKNIEKWHHNFIKQIKNRKSIKNVRCIGTILAFDIDTVEKTSYTNKIKTFLYNFFINKNILLRPLGNTIYILPPYCIKENEIELVYSVIKEALDLIENNDTI